ncbi:MFS transporter, NNP family, nitrate/nitrite transporter [Haloplanus vescus]|uniref:MFS transporter, NNP family, nitrate/nitrite transporter n=1 Tax=Haloplanus vescus TaxID=555874 RepID=A0A1H3VS80_9EURY|nr:MFS transporter, NNP family, nitrate/nitrite transporter [Haloplanus vescus]
MLNLSIGRPPFGGSTWQVVTIATGWLVLLFVGAYLITPASVLTLVMADLAVTEATAAALVSTPQVAATVIGIPVGIYLDRIESRAAVPAAASILLAGSVGDWFAASGGRVSLLIATRLLAGVGMFVLWVVSIDVASSTFPPDRRATATSVIISGYPAGYALGQLGAPRLADIVGWPGVFPLFGGAVLLTSLVFYVVVGRVSRFQTATDPMTRAEFGRVLRNRNVWAVVAVTILGYSLYMVFNSWMPTYITRRFGVSLAESGAFVALFPAVGILARPTGGWLSDTVFTQRRRPVFAASFVGATALAVAMFYSATIAVLVAMLVLAGAFIQLQIGLMYQSIQEFVDPTAAGTAVSLASVAGWLGSFVAPVVAGELVSITGTYAVLFVFAAGLGVVGALTVWQMAESGTPSASA